MASHRILPETMRICCSRYLCLLLLLVLAALIIPDALLSRHGAREQIIKYIENASRCEMSVHDIKWRWLPIPHLEIKDISIANHTFSAKVRQIDINPAIFNTLNGNPGIDSIICFNPSLEISGFDVADTSFVIPDIPLNITVKDGLLTINSGIGGNSLLGRAAGAFLSKINGSVDVRNGRVDGAVNFSSSYAHTVKISGWVMPDAMKYDVRLRIENGLFEKILKTVTGYENHQYSLSRFNIDIHAEGNGPDRLNMKLLADSPCLFKKNQDKVPLISCGSVAMRAKRIGDDLNINIDQFDSMSPEFSLSGRLDMHSVFNSGNLRLDMNLQGEDVELYDVRNKVLALFGDNSIAKEVCDIVRGGRASAIGFRFSGAIDDFADLSSMLITADLYDVPVMVPEIQLFIKKAAGRIKIEDGILYGYDMSAELEKSQASKGSITVGIGEDRNQLEVDFDVDVSLDELHSILGEIVPDEDFHKEIEMIHDVEGRASGHMYLGNDFRDFGVDVDILKVSGSAFYTRLGMPVRLNSGILHIRQKKGSVAWSGVRGTAGNSLVSETSGTVGWNDGFDIGIDSLAADIDSEQLAGIFMNYSMFRERMAPVMTLISGQLHMDSFSLAGAVREPPLHFMMSFSARPEHLLVVSPLLPERVVVEQGEIRGSEKELAIRKMEVDTGGNRAMVSADLLHDWFSGFAGKATVSANITKEFSSWIKKNRVIPKAIYPETPCYADNIEFNIGGNTTMFEGKLLFPDKEASCFAAFSVNATDDSLHVKKLKLVSSGDVAEFSMDYETANGTELDGRFHGRLTADTLDRMLEENRYLRGSVEGNMNLLATYGKNIVLTGSFEANGVNISTDNDTAFFIDRLAVEANGTEVTSKGLVFNNHDESVNIIGEAELLPESIRVDIDAASEKMRYIMGDPMPFITGMRKVSPLNAGKGLKNSTDSKMRILGIPVYGDADIHIDEFMFNMPLSVAELATGKRFDSYLLTDIDARGTLFPTGELQGIIEQASMCGLSIKAKLRESDGNVSLIITGKSEHEIDFDEFMPCLNMNERLLEGPFSLNMKIVKTNGHWIDGWIKLNAHNGRLLRMHLLSQIFSVVNMVELLTPSGWSRIVSEGMEFKSLVHEGHIEDDSLVIDKLFLDGAGINIYGSGKILLDPPVYDMVLGIAPLQTVDTILTNVPLFGKALGGSQNSFVIIPVAVKGPVSEPQVSPMPADTVAEFMKRIFNTLTTPLTIFVPDNNGKDKEK